MLEDAVLVDAGLVREGVLADHCLVVLHREGGDRRDELGGAHQHGRLDAGGVGQHVAAGADGHDDLFQRGVAGALAQPVDGALDLAGAASEAGQRIGDREAEVVVAVCGEDPPLSAFGTRSRTARNMAAYSSGTV